MLIKKTVVLTSDVTVGYITLVRVGDSVGMKAVLNSEPHGKLYIGLRAGSKPQINVEITSRRTERDIAVDLNAMDDLGAILVDSDGKIVATGGKKEAVNAEKIYEAFSVKGEANAESAAVSETQKVSSEAEEVIADDAVSAPAYGEDAADETETDENAVNDIEDSETKEKETVFFKICVCTKESNALGGSAEWSATLSANTSWSNTILPLTVLTKGTVSNAAFSAAEYASESSSSDLG